MQLVKIISNISSKVFPVEKMELKETKYIIQVGEFQEISSCLREGSLYMKCLYFYKPFI